VPQPRAVPAAGHAARAPVARSVPRTQSVTIARAAMDLSVLAVRGKYMQTTVANAGAFLAGSDGIVGRAIGIVGA